MAAALDSGKVKPESTFNDTGSIELGGYTIYDWDRNAWGKQDMTGCMEHSLNVCLTWVAEQTGSSYFYSYMRAFGIGSHTNIDLAGEKVTPLAVPGDTNWYPINLGTNSFGQGLAVTPIQMVTAVGAVANDGKMMSPHILKAIIRNGEKTEFSPRVIGQPITAETAHTLTNMLAISLEQEASTALIDGYRVAGKTGTAEIPSPQGYVSSVTNASFVGWGPVDDPRFVVYVWLEKPKSSIWGSIVASPVFADVVQKLTVLMDIPDDSTRQQLASQK
jgi:cell division protein FtsI/penicillin-binding protein 2